MAPIESRAHGNFSDLPYESGLFGQGAAGERRGQRGDTSGENEAFGSHTSCAFQDVSQPTDIDPFILRKPVLPKMVKGGHVKHEVDTRIVCGNTIENGLDANVIRDVYVLPTNLWCPSLQRDGRIPAIHADHVTVPAQVGTDCGSKEAGRARNNDDTIFHNAGSG